VFRTPSILDPVRVQAEPGSGEPRRLRTRLDADDRREQIVEAARKLFAAQPYESVSTGDIAAAAGTTRTNIHYHFSTKRDLFLEVIGRFSRIPEDVVVAQGGSAESRVAAVFHRWLDALERNRATYVTMLHAASSSDPQVSGVVRQSMQAWERRLVEVVGLDPLSGPHAAMIRSFQAMVTDATAAWLERGELSRAHVEAMLSRVLLALGEAASDADGSAPG
jgi:AcrR family transcriptional regulator